MKKSALITGASRGIGKAAARALAAEGYDLYLICRHSRDALNDLKKELEDTLQISVTCFWGDVSSFSFIKEVFSEISHLDVLINNAGVSYVGLLTDMTEAEWDQILNTNLSASFYTCKCAVPLMLKEHRGKIINISSVWGERGASTEVAYSASKGGLNAFTKALAKELAPSNIQVNAIAYGMMDTDMNSCFNKEEIESVIAKIPADRMGTGAEAAEMILQIINSPPYLTGQIITMDGGWQ